MLDNLQQSPTDMYRKSGCIIINLQKGREATLRGIHAPLGIQLKTVLTVKYIYSASIFYAIQIILFSNIFSFF